MLPWPCIYYKCIVVIMCNSYNNNIMDHRSRVYIDFIEVPARKVCPYYRINFDTKESGHLSYDACSIWERD